MELGIQKLMKAGSSGNRSRPMHITSHLSQQDKLKQQLEIAHSVYDKQLTKVTQLQLLLEQEELKLRAFMRNLGRIKSLR